MPLSRVRFVDVSGQGAIHMIGVEGDSGSMSGYAPSAPPPMPYLPPHGGIPVYPPNPIPFIPPHGAPHGQYPGSGGSKF